VALATAFLLTALWALWVWALKRQVRERTGALTAHRERLWRSEAALASSSALLHATNEAVRDSVLVVDRGGRPLEWNSQFLLVFGMVATEVERGTGRFARMLAERFTDGAGFAGYWQRHNSGRHAAETREWGLKDETTTEVESYTAPVVGLDGEVTGRVWVFRDLTAQRALEKSLSQAQKMEAVGRLAGGIAHDFNNLITGISGNLNLARLNADRPLADSLHYLANAESAARRAADLVRQLLGFSRQTNLDLAPRDANRVIEDLLALVRPSFDASITVQAKLAQGLWPARVDATQLEQVVLNLCVNARDAMPEGGVLTIATSNVKAAREPGAELQDCVQIEVEDTGTGIPEAVQHRIFEPFFSTKEQGKGTGLGLAMSYGIIDQHGGWISFRSEVGRGSAFSIFLPRCDGRAEAPGPPAGSTARLADSAGRVLVVDDEAFVRAVSEGLLRHDGFSVASARDGAEALDLMEAEGGRFDLVLLDLTMPVMSGKKTLQALRQRFPRVPVVICSGYLVDLEAFAEETGARPDRFLQKPYEPDQLLGLARALVGRPIAPPLARDTGSPAISLPS
jgi:signal transduction histidine kinase/CheY-like chemotaxis protein